MEKKWFLLDDDDDDDEPYYKTTVVCKPTCKKCWPRTSRVYIDYLYIHITPGTLWMSFLMDSFWTLQKAVMYSTQKKNINQSIEKKMVDPVCSR